MPVTPHSSFRLSPDAKKLLLKVSHHYGVSATAALEWIIRDKAREMPATRGTSTSSEGLTTRRKRA